MKSCCRSYGFAGQRLPWLSKSGSQSPISQKVKTQSKDLRKSTGNGQK